jgi:DNA-binding response OmpR family regulator
MRVLVIDDDTALRETLRDTLALRNLDVDCADSATDAISKLDENDYDVVLIDYVMPEHDGIWFMNNATLPRKTKTLLMTGHVDRSVISQMFNLGACGYIIKPFDEDELVRNLDFFLPGRISA